jgi:type VI secretion system protein VasJ
MDYSEKLCNYYLELARLPCSPSAFAGSDMRFSGEFEALEAELGKVHSIHRASLPDWQVISELSEHFLREHSKDLRVVVWLAWALHQRDSFAGLLAGLGLLRHLCEHHWAVVYHKVMPYVKARSAFIVDCASTILKQYLNKARSKKEKQHGQRRFGSTQGTYQYHLQTCGRRCPGRSRTTAEVAGAGGFFSA